MQSTIFDTPVLKVKTLETKFDTIVLSNSFIAFLDNNYIQARILQQLHYWCYSQYGVVIDGIRWIYKPLREWLSEALAGVTDWKLRVAIASLLEKGLIKREKLYVKHHQLKYDNPYWNPKNQTYYYSVNYDKLQELIDQAENRFEKAKKDGAFKDSNSIRVTAPPETIENVRIEDSTKLSVEDFTDTKYCELSQNKTKNTSTENISRDESHPHLPCVGEPKKEEKNPRKQDLRNPEKVQNQQINSFDSKVLEKDINIGQVEEKINQNTSTNQKAVVQGEDEGKGNKNLSPLTVSLSPNGDVPESVQVEVEKPRLKTPKGTKPKSKRRNEAPWKDEGQFKRFYRELIEALPIVANARSPQGLAQTIIRQLRSGIPHSYWDDFVAGLPIGTSTKPEWEVKPGIPHPMFIEYLTEKLIKGNNSQTREQALANALNIASSPKQAMFFWKECKISLGNAIEEAERHRKLGVKALPTPLWTKERPEPTLAQAAIAGTKIQQINNSPGASLEAAKNRQIESQKESPTPDPWKDVEKGLGGSGQGVGETRGRGDLSRASGDEETVSQSPSPQVPQSPSLQFPDTRHPSEQSDDQPSLSMREMLAARGVKGFCKAMPKVSREEAEAEAKAEAEALQRQQMNRKTHISQMSLAEINELVKDPILRAELTPQLINSNYELIFDYLGQIIGVKLSDLQIREMQALQLEE